MENNSIKIGETAKPVSGITTHVLDTSRGRPAAGVPATLEVEAAGGWKLVGKGTTNSDGRISDLVPKEAESTAEKIKSRISQAQELATAISEASKPNQKRK